MTPALSAPRARRPDEFALSDEYQALKGRLHRHIIQVAEAENAAIEGWSRDTLRRFVEAKLADAITRERLAVNRREAESLADDMVDELVGLGPIQRLVDDDAVSDVLVNGALSVFVERDGKLSRAPVRFIDDRHVLRIVQRIIAPLGRRIDESSPMVDARLSDGSRVNAVIPPLAIDGPCLSIRKFRREPLRAADLIASGTLSDAMLGLLTKAVRGRCNLLISGGTGSGKTTLLNVLSQSIPHDERLLTIEDAAELRLGHPHVVRLETRPPNLDGEGEVAARALLRNALRMRPDRILIGEIRDVEVMDMLQAMNTGHDGSMGTIHANNPRDCLGRLELLAGFAGFQGSERTLRHNIVSAVDLIVQLERLASGERRVTSVSELITVGEGQYQLEELHRFDELSGKHVESLARPIRPRLKEAVRADATKRASTGAALGLGGVRYV